MRRRHLIDGAVLCVCLAVLGFAWGGESKAASSLPSRPLQTAIFDPLSFPGPDGAVAFSHAEQTGASVVRLFLDWAAVAPTRPRPSSDPTNPANPAYHWEPVDRQVKLAFRNHLEPIIDVFDPPAWARQPADDGSVTLPQLRQPADVGTFVHAAARRYGGDFRGLPRVRYWQVWNEPNVSVYLSPQYEDRKAASPAIYRRIVNAAADALHAVHVDNVVIAGGQSPFGQGDAETDPTTNHVALSPMSFMQELLCMSGGSTPQPTCDDIVKFDVWAHHPYTHGGPFDKASNPGNVSIGDLPSMKRLLDAAVKAHHVESRGSVRFWVTEFSWDSKPTDPMGVPVRLEAQWVAEAMHQMWKSGVSLVTWFLVHEQPWSPSAGDLGHFQSSLYQPGAMIAQDKPKPALAAFRFPFVGHVEKGKVSVWGRTPWGRPGRVLVEQLRTGGWTRLGIVSTDRYGIFRQTFNAPAKGYVRARELRRGGLAAPSFPLTPLKDLPVQPFGS